MTRLLAGLLTAAAVAATAPAQDKAAIAAVTAAVEKAADVVRKAVDAHGGAAALTKFPAGTSKLAGKVEGAAGEIGFVGDLAFAVPGKVRLVMSLEAFGQKVEVVQVVNGDKVKHTENGKPTDLTPAVKAELVESAVIHELSLLAPLLDPARFTLAAAADEKVDGRDCAAVAVTAKGLRETKLYFDKRTGLLAGMRRRGLSPEQKPVDELTTFDDYKAVGGMKVPMRSKVSHDGKPFMTVTVAEYTPADKLDPKLFAVE